MHSNPAVLPPEARTHPLYRIKAWTDWLLGWALVALMALAVVNVLWQVFTRFLLGDPSAFTDELARYLLIWVSLFGAAYASGKRMHLAIDLLAARLKGRSKHHQGIVVELMVALFALSVMVVGGIRLVSLSFLLGQTSAALQLPLGFIYLAVPASGALIAFYMALFVIERIRLLGGLAPTLLELMETPAEAFAEGVDPARNPSDDASLTRPEAP